MTPQEKILHKFPGIAKVLDYHNSKTPVTLECPTGHRWTSIPSNLLARGSGAKCPGCNNLPQYALQEGVYVFSRKKSTTDFAQQLPAGITLVSEYVGAKEPVTLKCACGHTWQALPTNVLSRGAHCQQCAPSAAQSLQSAKAKIHAKYPELTLIEYSDSSHEVTVRGPCSHQFTSWYANLVQGRGYRCSTCVPQYATSKNEKAILDFIRSQYNGWVIENDRTLIKPKELDILLPDLGLAVEYNAPYTHHNKDHLIKLQQVEAVGFRLLQISEHEWNNKQQQVKAKLQAILGKNLKVYARQCTLEQIAFPREFLEANHLQGAGQPTSLNYGLYLQDELVAVMTFGTPRFTAAQDYELIRFCSLQGVTVVGGASKLLKAFVRDNPNKTLLSYADRRWSQGSLYQSLGFTHHHDSAPGYAYYKNNRKLSRYQAQKQNLKTLFPEAYSDSLTETEIMELAGYCKMYDCGMSVWVKE